MNGRKCGNCNYCKRVYRRYEYDFWRDGKFYCTNRNDLTRPESRCGEWQRKIEEYDLSSERLKSAETDVKFIINVLNANKSDIL